MQVWKLKVEYMLLLILFASCKPRLIHMLISLYIIFYPHSCARASLCKHVPHAAVEHLRAVAAIAARRLGSSPPLEPTEELRLAACQLLNALLQAAIDARADAALAHSVDDIVAVAAKSLGDAFPDLKKESASTVLLLASARDCFSDDDDGDASQSESAKAKGSALAQCALDTYYPTLAQAAVANLGHQRNPVRLAALQAIGALLLADRRHSGDSLRAWAEALLPALMQLTNDRTPAVRQELVKVSGTAVVRMADNNSTKQSGLLQS